MDTRFFTMLVTQRTSVFILTMADLFRLRLNAGKYWIWQNFILTMADLFRLRLNAGKYWIWQKLFPEILNISFIIKRENLFRGILIFRIWGVVVRD